MSAGSKRWTLRYAASVWSRLGASQVAAINDGMTPTHESPESTETIDPQLLEAAIAVFGDKKSALNWLPKPLRTLGTKRPRDVAIEQALSLIQRIKHGFGA
ncbi:antitoxin Xre/MbcA/ParS toxin-binding domain-containing protein [Pseudomonas fluorescens]|uniref:Antitoxin Xre/MbcA/ParS-like toxin-binding domain-containing protein n=1 Tax=Pseudomonas fluorescens TaxID=294 RepID=A0A5E6X6D1_PSEFL|nr:antitoxin Xre/MbcA/ParS toxin-binding domain-containing protein [Pseudomonas fluorescens]VVN36147.1 hypothetical protein PS652_05130 [Pseudomonas fluorescens]